jgi:hypothetical protein
MGTYNLASGGLEANGLYLRGSLAAGIYGQRPFLRLGGVLNMGGALTLNTSNTVLGQVQLADNASIYLAGNGPIQHFADSSSLSWNSGSILTIGGWGGSQSGGGATQIYFGNSSSGLTPAQVAQIRFHDPAGMPTGNYHAQILATGEVVPTGPPPPVSGWGVSTYSDTLQYPGTNRNIVALATRDGNSIAAGTDGSAVAWGDAAAFSNAPPLNNVMGVAAGSRFLMVLYNNGTVAAWGANNPGPTSGPPGLANVVAIAAGNSYAIALKADGTITGWGANDLGQLNVPSGAMPAIAITAGQFHNLAIRPDNTVVAWGNNDSGQCNVPPGLSNVVAVSASGSFSLALRSDGTVAAWGAGSFYGETNVPAGLSNVVAIAAGDHHVIALRSNGSIVGWGSYYYNGTGVPPWATNIVEIAAGSDYTLAVTAGGERLHGQITQPRWTPSPSNPAVRAFAGSVPSRSGQVLRLEYVPSLSQTNWIGLPLFTGRAGTTTLYDNNPADPVRFYRVRQW